MDVTFRLANADDINVLLEFMLEFYEFDHLDFDSAAARAALQAMLKDDALGSIWLIQMGEKSIGYIALTLGFSLEFQGRDAFVDEIYIRANYRGSGIGGKALEFVVRACRSLGVKALHLEVARDNENALALYRKLGFKERSQILLTRRIAD